MKAKANLSRSEVADQRVELRRLMDRIRDDLISVGELASKAQRIAYDDEQFRIVSRDVYEWIEEVNGSIGSAIYDLDLYRATRPLPFA